MPLPAAGERVQASDWTDVFPVGVDAWEPYTPTWSGTLGNGTISGKYMKIGRFFRAKVSLVWGSTTSHGGGAQTIGTPVTAVTNGEHNGGARIIDTSASAQFYRHTFFTTTTAVAFATEAGVFVTGTSPMTWANGDSMHLAFSGESAT